MAKQLYAIHSGVQGKPSYRTDLKILYDDKNIYVAIRAYDNMKDMTRRLARRDTYSGDLVGIQFDSYFDHRTAFEFDMTSAGQKIDCWVSNDGWDLNWNAVWYGKVAYEDSAWTAETFTCSNDSYKDIIIDSLQTQVSKTRIALNAFVVWQTRGNKNKSYD